MVSSKDVAKFAGVSQTTVSRVLNTPHLVKEKTVKKVMAAIDELNYFPDSNARSLVRQKTGTIALISGPLHNPFFVETTTAIVNYATKQGYRINVNFVNEDNLEGTYHAVFENKVDGIILSSILIEDPIFDKLERSNIPFITFNRKHKSNKNFVAIDDGQAGYLAHKHLMELGHEDIYWVGGPMAISTFKGRYEGFVKAGEEVGKDIAPSHVFLTDTTQDDIHQTFLALQKLAQRPLAICAATDAIALRLMHHWTEAGYRIPEDISIIGIDNVEMSRHASINLTTVGIEERDGLGDTAIELLLEMIEQKNNSCIQVTKPVRLFERNTTMKK